MEEPSTHGEVPSRARPATPRRGTLTRQAVVAAAMRLADAEGLAAVSIRRVATDLGARTMSLYSHIDSKDDLLDLMREQVAAETVIAGPLPPGWRAATLAIARRGRATTLRHPWLIQLLGHRNRPGPNLIRHLEQFLAALSGLTRDRRAALSIAAAVDELVLGHVIGEITRAAPAPRSDDTFERTLTWLLDGIEAAHRP